MGCWHETCGFTNMAISDGEPVRLMAIGRVPDKDSNRDSSLYGAFDLFLPVSILAKGTYNDYGWLDFAEGEEERFFNSARSIGIGLKKEKEDNPKFPPHHYQWMIREDAFQMAMEIPLDHWGDDHPKTVGEAVEKKWKIIRDIRPKLRTESADSEIGFDLREQYNEIFGRGEMPYWPLKSQLHTYSFRGLTLEQTDEEMDRKFDDLMNLFVVFIAMNNLRKILVPTNGAGSQHFNDDGYMVLSRYYEQAAKKWRDGFD